MKKYLILLILVFMPCAYAIKTGVIVDVNGDLHQGCVNIDKGNSAYDALAAFDKQDSGLDMKFVTVPAPFLESINGIKGASVGSDGWQGWNFWVSNNDNGFKEPPELSPGFGMGIGDYKITKENDVIGVNYALTLYNLDWTVKTAPEKPTFIKYADLCDKLQITSLDIKADGKKKTSNENGATIKIVPGADIKIDVKLKNTYSKSEDISMNNVYIEGSMNDVNEKDIDETSDDKDINAGDEKTFSISFTLPKTLDSDSYDLTLAINAKDANGLDFSSEIPYTLDVDREKHEIIIESAELTPKKLTCTNNFALDVKLFNNGEEDEDVDLTVSNAELNIDQYDNLSISQGEEGSKTFTFKLNNVNEGEYPLLIEAAYMGKTSQITINLLKLPCPSDGTATSTVKEENTIVSAPIKNEVVQLSTVSQPIQNQAKPLKVPDNTPIFVGFAILTGIILALTILVILLKK